MPITVTQLGPAEIVTKLTLSLQPVLRTTEDLEQPLSTDNDMLSL